MKKGLLSGTVLLFSVLLFTSPISSYANEQDDQELKKLNDEKGVIIYQDEDITVRTFGNDEEISDAIFNHPDSTVATTNSNPLGIQPLSSATGPGGRASLVVLNSREVDWSVRPSTAWPYNFSGKIKLRYYSGYNRDVVIGGMGALGSSVSGAVTMNKNNGGVAYLSGRATALTGDKYSVLPGINQSFSGY